MSLHADSFQSPAPADAPPMRHDSVAVADVSVVIITRNRFERVRRTIDALEKLVPRPAEIILVDNASTDDTTARFSKDPRVRFIELDDNRGVEAFNIGVKSAKCPNLLILDDDATPEPAGWSRAIAMFETDASIAAIAFNPVHPATGVREWPDASRTDDRFNRMGCANLVRTATWRECGGYLGEYFLYRNDTDLALTILSRGGVVYFDPAILAMHDSPFAAVKSDMWLRLATRNWIWMARRHGRGSWKWIGITFGICRAFGFAGIDITRFARVMQGVAQGFVGAPPMPPTRSDGSAWKSLIARRIGL